MRVLSLSRLVPLVVNLTTATSVEFWRSRLLEQLTLKRHPTAPQAKAILEVRSCALLCVVWR